MTQRPQRPGLRVCGPSRRAWDASAPPPAPTPTPSIRSRSSSARSGNERHPKRKQRPVQAIRRSCTPHISASFEGSNSDDRQRRRQRRPAQRSGRGVGRAKVVQLDGSTLSLFKGSAGPAACLGYNVNEDGGDKIATSENRASACGSKLARSNCSMLARREDNIRRPANNIRSKRRYSTSSTATDLEQSRKKTKSKSKSKSKRSEVSATAITGGPTTRRDATTVTIRSTRLRTLRCPNSIDQRRPIVSASKCDEDTTTRGQPSRNPVQSQRVNRATDAINPSDRLKLSLRTTTTEITRSSGSTRSASSAAPTRNQGTMFVPSSVIDGRTSSSSLSSSSSSSAHSSSTPAATRLAASGLLDDRRWLLSAGLAQSQEAYEAGLMAASPFGSSNTSGPHQKKQKTVDETDLIKSASRAHRWHWSESDKSHECVIGKDKLSLCFHPQCSESTATCRGSEPFRRNANYYYWEIHVQDKVYGTSVMFGLCTKQQRMHANEYCNLVGLDDQGWSLSHKGLIWHNGIRRQFTGLFPVNQPITIGLLYNTLRGELSYFMDGKNLGVAFCGLNDIEDDLYPVVGSTAKSTRMRLIGSYCGYVSLLERSCFTLIRGNKNVGELIEYLRQSRLPKSLVDYVAQVANVCSARTDAIATSKTGNNNNSQLKNNSSNQDNYQ